MRDLLLLLCRYPFREENREPLSRLIREVQDWDKLVELINEHGIIALAAYNIKEAGLVKEIPPDAMAIIENGYLQSVARNSWLAERWKEINTILSDAGLKHVLLKGMALEHTLYHAKGLRQMNDCDIFVKRQEAIKAWHLLKQNGFSHNLIKSPLYKKILPDIGKHLPPLSKDGFTVEIHHKLFDDFDRGSKNYSDPVEDAVEISIHDTKAWILPKELQLMYLIDHLNRHRMEGSLQLRLYTDISLLDKTEKKIIPDDFINEPNQEHKREYRRAAYRISVSSVPLRIRFRYLAGDIFPSIEWMKKRYKCSGVKALLYYPQRIAKLGWLV